MSIFEVDWEVSMTLVSQNIFLCWPPIFVLGLAQRLKQYSSPIVGYVQRMRGFLKVEKLTLAVWTVTHRCVWHLWGITQGWQWHCDVFYISFQIHRLSGLPVMWGWARETEVNSSLSVWSPCEPEGLEVGPPLCVPVNIWFTPESSSSPSQQ